MLDFFLSQPDLVKMIVLGVGVFAVLLLALASFDLLDGNDKHMQRRFERIVDPHATISHTVTSVESVRRNMSDSKIASVDRLIKGALPNIGLLRLRLERSGWPSRLATISSSALGYG